MNWFKEFPHYVWPIATFATGLAAWFGAMLLVLTKSLYFRDSITTSNVVQRVHVEPTPRIGGLALYFSVLLGTVLSTGESRHFLMYLVMAGTPAFAFGLLEDCTHRVPVVTRLFATLGSGILGCFITGSTITGIDVPLIDTLLMWAPLSVVFTAFAVSGVANAFNIIDGFNGLASGTAMIALWAMGLVGLHLGDVQLVNVCVILAAAITGFLLVNWPFGKLFMGDGGAYFVGFAVAWVAVLLLEHHPEVSAWCPLLICAYPVLEVVFSMRRRRLRNQIVGHADRLHLHSLVKRRVVRQLFPRVNRTLRNSITGALLWAMTLLPSVWAVLLYDDTPQLMLGLVAFALAYHVLYVRLVRFGWHLRRPAGPPPVAHSSK